MGKTLENIPEGRGLNWFEISAMATGALIGALLGAYIQKQDLMEKAIDYINAQIHVSYIEQTINHPDTYELNNILYGLGESK